MTTEEEAREARAISQPIDPVEEAVDPVPIAADTGVVKVVDRLVAKEASQPTVREPIVSDNIVPFISSLEIEIQVHMHIQSE